MTTSVKQQVALAFSRAASSYDQAAHVQKLAAHELLLLLDADSHMASNALDLGCGTGYLARALSQPSHCRAQHVVALDIAPGMLRYSQQRDYDQGVDLHVCGDLEQLPFAAQTFDLIVSNFALQWCSDFAATLNEIHDLLKPEGRFLFCLPVQDTLCELKSSWREADTDYAHVNSFHSVTAVASMLASANFDVIHFNEHRHLQQVKSVKDLLTELKQVGAHRIMGNGTRTMMSKGRFQTMTKAYDKLRNSGGWLPATWHYVAVQGKRR